MMKKMALCIALSLGLSTVNVQAEVPWWQSKWLLGSAALIAGGVATWALVKWYGKATRTGGADKPPRYNYSFEFKSNEATVSYSGYSFDKNNGNSIEVVPLNFTAYLYDNRKKGDSLTRLYESRKPLEDKPPYFPNPFFPYTYFPYEHSQDRWKGKREKVNAGALAKVIVDSTGNALTTIVGPAGSKSGVVSKDPILRGGFMIVGGKAVEWSHKGNAITENDFKALRQFAGREFAGKEGSRISHIIVSVGVTGRVSVPELTWEYLAGASFKKDFRGQTTIYILTADKAILCYNYLQEKESANNRVAGLFSW